MLNVVEKSEELEAPAGTIEELLERLGPLIGRTLRIVVPPTYGYNAYTVFGALRWVRLVEDDEDDIEVDLGRIDATTENHTAELLELHCSVSVLTDGVWKVIHELELEEEEDY